MSESHNGLANAGSTTSDENHLVLEFFKLPVVDDISGHSVRDSELCVQT